MPTPRVALLTGRVGRGSNMARLARACQTGEVPAEVVLVVSPVAGTPAVETAQELGLAVAVIDPARPDYADALLDTLRSKMVSWVCLAGFTRLLPAAVVEAYRGRILNVHPALLPKFGGKGMYGTNVHRAVIEAGETESGCTVHLVDERYDEGAVLLQLRCPVVPGDTPDTLAARVLALEHIAYPRALRAAIEASDAG